MVIGGFNMPLGGEWLIGMDIWAANNRTGNPDAKIKRPCRDAAVG
jgi:hypothetical protein